MTTYDEPSDVELDAEIARAQNRGKDMQPLYAREMQYLKNEDAFFLRLFSGVTVTVPRAFIPGFGSLSVIELQDVHLAPGGNAIIVNDAVDYSVPGVLRIIAGITEQRRIAGSSRSEKKAAAVRENGRKGGRPKKTTA